MEAVRGETPDSGSGDGGVAATGSTGCRAPQWRQKGWVGPTWFPHWLQKGIYLSLRYASTICSGKPPRRSHPAMLTFWP
jgi:hypothetical protein